MAYFLMILNVIHVQTLFINVPPACANEDHIGVDKSIFTIVKQIWPQMIGYFLLMNSKRCFVLCLG